MAMTKCRECGKEISTTAGACPHCGAKPKPKTSGCAWVALIFIGIPIILSVFIGHFRDSERRAEETNRARESQKIAELEAARVAAMTPEQRAEEKKKTEEALMARMRAEAKRDGLLWNYDSSADPMGRGKLETASVRSLNTLSLDFPYQGQQRATLQLRKHPQHGREVIFYIEKGQLLCRRRSCAVNVRFGSGKPVQFEGAEPSDGRSEIIFILGHDRFLSALRKVDTVAIEVEIYKHGRQAMKFDVSGLEWN